MFLWSRIALVKFGYFLFNIPPLVFLWMLEWMTVHPFFRWLTRKQLTEAGKELGFKHQKSNLYSEFGVMDGTIDGHEVVVKPDAASISVFFLTDKQIEFAQHKPQTRPTKEMPDFDRPDSDFNLIFKTRRASRKVQTGLSQYPDALYAIVDFFSKWMIPLNSIRIDSSGFNITFRYGTPFYPYIPPFVMKRIIPDMIEVIRQIEKALGSKKDSY